LVGHALHYLALLDLHLPSRLPPLLLQRRRPGARASFATLAVASITAVPPVIAAVPPVVTAVPPVIADVPLAATVTVIVTAVIAAVIAATIF
jgi:hypothetical protein